MVKAFNPSTLEECLIALSKAEAVILNGGTDLMVKKKNWSGLTPNFNKPVIFINNLVELKNIKQEKNSLIIGSGCTFNQLAESEIIPKYFKEVINQIASPAIRNLATIGGNICNASPAGDILPALYALDAKLVLKSINKERVISIKDFILGPGKTSITPKEVLKEILLENFNQKSYHYHKLGTRKATALSKASFIGFYSIEDNIVKDIRIAFGSVGPIVIRDRDLELTFVGSSLQDLKFKMDDVIDRYSELIRPINDARSTAQYRKKVCLNLLRDFFENKITNSEFSL